MTLAGSRLELTVTDLKQYAYCPRIPYYTYVVPVDIRRPYKMERGKNVQAAVEALEKRRGFGRYRVAEGQRLFGVWLHSKRHGLAGKLDLLVKTPDSAHPVDFKDTDGPARANLKLQLAAYALLVEEAVGLPVPAAFVYFVPSRALEEVRIDQNLRDRALRALGDLHVMIAKQSMPGPTDVRARCVDCEYRNYCADIW